MFGFGVRRPENVTLPGRSNHACRIKSQSFKVAYDKVIVTEWLTGEMGHIALPIWDAIPTTKSCEGTGGADFLAEHPDPRATKLYKDLPDEVTGVYLTQTSFEGQVVAWGTVWFLQTLVGKHRPKWMKHSSSSIWWRVGIILRDWR